MVHLPKHPRERMLAKAACVAATKMQPPVDPRKIPLLVDVDSSDGYGTWGVNEFRCLLKSHPKGPWNSVTCKRVSIHDMARAQGFDPKALKWKAAKMTEHQLGQALGNGVTVPVLTALLKQCLIAIGFLA